MSTLRRITALVALACATIVLPVCAQDASPARHASASSTPVAGLDQVIEKLDLRDVLLADALRALGEESNVNLVASQDAAKTTVACYLQNVTVRQAIESLSKAYGLWYREDEQNGVVRVLTAKEFERDLTAFRDERTQVFTLNYPNAMAIARAIRDLYGSRVHFEVNRDTVYDEYDELSQRFQRFDILDRRAQSLGVFGENGGTNYNSSTGSNYGSSSSQGNRFTDTYQNGQRDEYNQRQQQQQQQNGQAQLTPDQLEAISRAAAQGEEADPYLLQKLRGTQPSIYVSIINRNNKLVVRSSDQTSVAEIAKLITALDVPTPQVLLEVRVLNLDLGDDFDSAFDASFRDQHILGTVGGVAPTGGGLLPGGFIYQYVNDNFTARLQFLQQRRRINTLATPMLLVANNEVSRLFVGEERPIVRNISSTVTQNNNQTVATPNTTIELVPVGTTLLLTPNINADRTVTLRVLQENSEINPGAASIPIVAADGTVTNQAIDTVKARTVTGTVVAKDGLTLALGGLVDESVSTTQSGVPGLMDIPLVGFLFRRESKQRSHTELVVLIKPHVLFTATETEEQSRDLTNRISIHPGASGKDTLGAYDADEVPRPPLGKHPLFEMLKLQSGLPDGH